MTTKVLPSQRLFKRFEERVILGEMTLSDVIRTGAQMRLQHAVELEMTAFLGRGYYENAPTTTSERGRRNGYEKHTVLTGEGRIEIDVSQVRDLPEDGPRFQSQILDAYVTRTETLDELITRMYVTGMSTRDIEIPFVEILAGREVSRSTVSRITERLAEDLEACLQSLKLPKEHHKRVRTTNLLERLLGENRRRVKVIPHFFTEKAGMKLIYASLLAASQKWRGVRMDPFIARALDDLWEQVFGQTRKVTWAA